MSHGPGTLNRKTRQGGVILTVQRHANDELRRHPVLRAVAFGQEVPGLRSHVPYCNAYLTEKAAKTVTEELRTQARADLDQYREQIFPTYEKTINDYLRRFAAGTVT